MKTAKICLAIWLSLCVVLVGFSVFANVKKGKKLFLAKPTGTKGIPGPVVCFVGATGTAIGYTGDVGSNTRPTPAFPYTWPDNDYLYGGGFMYMAYKDGVLTTTGEAVNIAPTDTFYWTSNTFDPNAVSAFDTKAQWKSMGLELEITQITHAWSESYRDDFIVWDFTFKNVGSTTLEGFMMAQRMDADVSIYGGYDHWLDDLTGFYGQYKGEFQVPTRWSDTWLESAPQADSIFISYMWDDDHPGIPGDDTGGRLIPKESEGFIGTSTIACPKPDEGDFAANQPSGHTWWNWNTDPGTYYEYYAYMRWGVDHPDAPYREVPPSPYDYRYYPGWGPYDISPGESIRIVVATGLGIGLEGLVKNMATAKKLFRNNWIGYTAPPAPATFSVIAGLNRVDISWSSEPETDTRDAVTGENDFEGYRLWKSEDGGGTWIMLAQYDIINNIGLNTGIRHEYTDYSVQTGYDYVYSITSFDKGDPTIGLESLESGRVTKMTTVRPGTLPLEVTKLTMDDIFAAPNPYKAYAYWNREPTSRIPPENRIGFFNLPKKCTIRIFTMGGDLVDEIKKDDETGQAYWDSISKWNIDVVSGVYLYHVQGYDAQGNKAGDFVGKFVVIK